MEIIEMEETFACKIDWGNAILLLAKRKLFFKTNAKFLGVRVHCVRECKWIEK